MEDRIKNLKKNTKSLNQKWNDLYSIFVKCAKRSNNIDLSNKYSSNKSISEINLVIISITEWFNASLPKDENETSGLLLNQNYLEETSQILELISDKISGIIAQLKPINTNPSSLESVQAGPKLVIANIGEIDISAPLSEINNNLTAVINLLEKISILLNNKPTANWEDYLLSLQKTKITAENLGDDINNVLEDSKNISSEINNILENSKNILKDINEFKESADKSKLSINSALGEVTTKLEQIREIASDADSLESKVKEYNSKLDAFDRELDDRLEKFSQFKEDVEELENKRKKDEEEIERITEKADKMIRGATVAGLSYSLDQARKKYSDSMFWAGIFFYLSIFILFVVSFALAQYSIPGISQIFDTFKSVENTDQVDVVSISLPGLISRLVLLLPAIWLTAFCSRRYRILSNLERQYSFKAALAQSVEGFKSESPEYADAITASIFMDIRQEPLGDNKDKSEHDGPPNLFADWIYKKLQRRLDNEDNSD